jgi:hypothetical protein
MVIVPKVELYKPGDIFLEHWGEKFGFVDDRGKIHYIGAYKDVDTILNALYYKEPIR